MAGTERPRLAITLGDPAGIGPEVVVKALTHDEVYTRADPLVIGDRRVLERTVAALGLPLKIQAVTDVRDAVYSPGTVTVLDLANADPATFQVGEESAVAGGAAVDYVFRACDLAMAGEVDAIVTAPLNKAAMHMAGYTYAGHTELLTERTHAPRVSMLLIGPGLRIVHVST
ncbi:MAG: 4-hydroxythreonine-4-phosphate dehydrogenase PdxA, partial [Thermomicrobiales bacterium]|nr:4-hydroxythreonine-4-phosphate dehydrogenase PdxA [Thermomicrobiales bacterium]